MKIDFFHNLNYGSFYIEMVDPPSGKEFLVSIIDRFKINIFKSRICSTNLPYKALRTNLTNMNPELHHFYFYNEWVPKIIEQINIFNSLGEEAENIKNHDERGHVKELPSGIYYFTTRFSTSQVNNNIQIIN